ncbi:acyltransferase family protein [Rhizobium sp. CCGE532]|uniref:acyltransferase family protein n=1 Tax=Rhizobium sp. CCGE532 TaxID=2364272 RepID=UPI0013C3F561|nr:acyltransferase family protein [Rhizobium sp. CCGE532]
MDAIRGLAAIAVVHFHMGLIWHVAPFGYLAVDFFFALSGFVTEVVYGPRFMTGMTTSRFVVTRLERLYPVFLVGIFLGAFVIVAKVFVGVDRPPAWVVPLNLAILPAPVAGDYFPVNVPCWTLFLEFTAYFLY